MHRRNLERKTKYMINPHFHLGFKFWISSKTFLKFPLAVQYSGIDRAERCSINETNKSKKQPKKKSDRRNLLWQKCFYTLLNWWFFFCWCSALLWTTDNPNNNKIHKTFFCCCFSIPMLRDIHFCRIMNDSNKKKTYKKIRKVFNHFFFLSRFLSFSLLFKPTYIDVLPTKNSCLWFVHLPQKKRKPSSIT